MVFMYKRLKREKHKYSHSRYVKHAEKNYEVKKEVVEPVLEETEKTSKVKSFFRSQKLAHTLEIEEKNKQVDQALRSKNDANTQLDSEKYKVKQLKEQLKEQSKKMKEEKKHFSQEKKNLKRAKKKNYGLTSSIIVTIITTLSALVFFTVKWLFHTWPNLKMDELVYQLTAPTEGTGTDMYWQFFYQAGIPTIICLAVVIGIMIFIAYASNKLRVIAKRVLVCVSILCMSIAGVKFNNQLDVKEYLSNKGEDSTFIEENYVDPSSVDITFPETKRNLVMIYLESMEMTYADQDSGGGFEENDIPELTQLSLENENFSGTNDTLNGAVSLSGTTWTMGGLFASTSGLPLITDFNDWNSMDTQDSFFGEATVLGDILKENGYQQVFACGSDGTFGGRRLYFESHGDYELHDLNYRKNTGELPEDYYVWWGFEDQKLIEWAKNDLSELASSDEPFNYTMLTVDTHFEDGYVCDLCEDEHEGNQYANVMSCSSRQVSELISWIQQQDWYENTTIVLTGDHPTMDSDFCDDVSEDYQRRVYTAYINAQPTENNSEGMRSYSTFDTFPTVVASLGASIEGDHLGLGTNLFSNEETLVEKDGIEMINREFAKNSTFLNELANINYNSSGMRSRGSGIGMNVVLDSISDNELSFTCSDLYGINGTLNSVEVTVQDSDGNIVNNMMDYQGSGTFTSTIEVPNGNLSSVYIKMEIHSTDPNGESVTETAYEYNGNIQLLNGSQGSLSKYVEGLLNLDTNQYTILITSQGSGSSNISETDKVLLGKLGAGNVAGSEGRASFAIIHGGEAYSKVSNDYLREDGYLDDGTPCVISSSANEEQVSSILLGYEYTEYSFEQEGINIVVWDCYNHAIVSQRSFGGDDETPSIESVSLKTSMLSSDVEVIATDPKHTDSCKNVIAVVYDNDDCGDIEEVTMSLKYDNTYTATLTNQKKNLENKMICIYAVYEDSSRLLLGSYTE